MFDKFDRALRRLHRGQKGITGLETAIILIAFVTVASVLAYSVLSAGIFSAERGKEAVYRGLEAAQSTIESRGSVIATSSDNTTVQYLIFNLAMVLEGQSVDLTAPTSNVTVINYYDSNSRETNVSWTKTLLNVERGAVDMLEDDELMEITLDVSTFNLVSYDTFVVEIIPPVGSSITLTRTVPGAVQTVMNLN